MVPAITALPVCLETARASPVMKDSSTVELPSVTMPSTGICVPGFTRSKSPICTSASAISCSCPADESRMAFVGVSASKERIAVLERERARNSKTCPNKTRVTITAADSK